MKTRVYSDIPAGSPGWFNIGYHPAGFALVTGDRWEAVRWLNERDKEREAVRPAVDAWENEGGRVP